MIKQLGSDYPVNLTGMLFTLTTIIHCSINHCDVMRKFLVSLYTSPYPNKIIHWQTQTHTLHWTTQMHTHTHTTHHTHYTTVHTHTTPHIHTLHYTHTTLHYTTLQYTHYTTVHTHTHTHTHHTKHMRVHTYTHHQFLTSTHTSTKDILWYHISTHYGASQQYHGLSDLLPYKVLSNNNTVLVTLHCYKIWLLLQMIH